MCMGGGGQQPSAPVNTPGYSVQDSRASLNITDTPADKAPVEEKTTPRPAAQVTSQATGADFNSLEV